MFFHLVAANATQQGLALFRADALGATKVLLSGVLHSWEGFTNQRPAVDHCIASASQRKVWRTSSFDVLSLSCERRATFTERKSCSHAPPICVAAGGLKCHAIALPAN